MAASSPARVVNAMTVDVEDYFQVSAFDDVVPRSHWETMESRVSRNTERLLDLFDEFRVRGTFFVLGWIAERQPALIREIARRGHELASHGYGHRLIYTQTPETFRDDIQRARRVIEDTAGVRVRGYRAPSFSITPKSLWAFDVLIEEGHEYDASVFPIRHDRYGMPDAPRHAYLVSRAAGSLVEAPASTVRLGSANLPIAGGGYFRLLPYAWTRWGVRRVNEREGRPAIFYLHPWEIDPDQPRLQASRLSRFRHYRNLHRTESRLRQLLWDFRFDAIDRLVDEVRAGAPALAPAPAAMA